MAENQLRGEEQDRESNSAGQGSPTTDNPRSVFQKKDVTDLQNRMKALEEEVLALKERVASLEVNLEPGLVGPSISPNDSRRGPKPKITDSELLSYRDGLVLWFELIWPKIGSQLCTASTTKEILSLLEAGFREHAPAEQKNCSVLERTDLCLRPFERRLLEHPEALLEFLTSGPTDANPANLPRFHGKPPKQAVVDALNRPWRDPARWKAAARLPTRQVANAMAGVPDLDWRTSLDRCTRIPSELMVGMETEQHYRKLFEIPERKPLEGRPDRKSNRASQKRTKAF
jgi:hypothetical protein